MRHIFFLLLAIFIGSALSAQTTSTHTVTLNLSNAIEMNFVTGASGVGLTFNSTSNYQNGIVADNAATIQVKSNRGFNVSVKAGSSNSSSTSATVMPVANVLFVKEATQTNFIGVSTSEQTVISGQSKGIKSFGLSYKATPGYSYDGGNYTVNVIYTATQQ